MDKSQGLPVRLVPALMCYEELSKKKGGDGRYTIVEAGQNELNQPVFKVIEKSGVSTQESKSELSSKLVVQLKTDKKPGYGGANLKDLCEKESGTRQETRVNLVKGALQRLQKEGLFVEEKEAKFVARQIGKMDESVEESKEKELANKEHPFYRDFPRHMITQQYGESILKEVRQWDPDMEPRSLEEVLNSLPKIQKENSDRREKITKNIGQILKTRLATYLIHRCLFGR